MTSRASARETIALALALLALLLLTVIAHDVLLTRPLWLDEIHTRIVASRPTPAAVIGDLRAGVDTAPGLLHLVLWGVGTLAGLSPFVLHLVPFLLVWAAVVAVVATLRRELGAAASVAGALAVITHPLVIQMTYEARFYGPWLALAAAFAWATGLPASRRRDVAIATLAALICTIHWFGVISLGIMCAAVVAAHGRAWRTGLRLVAPAAAGLVALLATLPILMGQRAAVTAPTWIPAPDATQLWTMARVFYVAAVPLAALALLAGHWFVTRRTGAPASPSTARLAHAGGAPLVALASLALMPVALAVFSYVAQPALLDRYATVATLAWAPLVALAVQRIPGIARIAACAFLLAVGILHYRHAVRGMERYAATLGESVASFGMAVERSRLPIVFQSRHEHMQIVEAHPRGRERTIFLALPDSTLDALFPSDGRLRLIGPFLRFEREAALLHERVYGFPVTRRPAQLAGVPQFVFVATDASLPAGYRNVERFLAAVFPGRAVTRLNDRLALVR